MTYYDFQVVFAIILPSNSHVTVIYRIHCNVTLIALSWRVPKWHKKGNHLVTFHKGLQWLLHSRVSDTWESPLDFIMTLFADSSHCNGHDDFKFKSWNRGHMRITNCFIVNAPGESIQSNNFVVSKWQSFENINEKNGRYIILF